MHKALIIILLSIIIGSCNFDRISSLDWIVGDWKRVGVNVEQGEIWERTESGYFGKSWSVQSSDTIITETMTIYMENDSLFMEVLHFSQNDGQAVVFKGVYDSSQKFTFENRQHDWPQFITYWKEDDHLKAHVGSYRLEDNEVWFEWNKSN